MYPKRSKVSDGSIGDTRHKNSKSDHNPNSKGVVCAVDITFDKDPSDGVGVDCNWLAKVLTKNRDPRIKYIIWNNQIMSSLKDPWKWRPYSGANPHKHHLHISVVGDYDNKAPWNLSSGEEPRVDKTKVDDAWLENKVVTKYKVRSGDTLSAIAKRFSTSVDDIKKKNSLASDLIKVGQILEL